MSQSVAFSRPPGRVLVAGGALFAALGVGLSAYASHVALDEGRAAMQMAALFAMVHGVALASLAPHATRSLGRTALAAMLVGVLLFSGSLAAAHFLGAPTALAPYGGGLMILAWLAYAVDALRH